MRQSVRTIRTQLIRSHFVRSHLRGADLFGSAASRSLLASFVLFAMLLLALPAIGADATGLTKGMQLAKQGKYKEAVAALRAAPQGSTNLYYQGYCYYQLNHQSDAKMFFASVISNYPRSAEAKLAADFLSRIDPSYVKPAAAGAPPAATSSASQSRDTDAAPDASKALASILQLENGEEPADLAKLPSDARIFFTTASSGHMIVDASINGHPYKCMFDTGAPGLLFGKNNLKAMGVIPPQGPPTTSVSGWAGVRLPAWKMNLTVKVGNVERTLPATVQEELDNIPPLIGYAFIKGYQYEIDQKAQCMTLKKEQGNQQSINNLYDVPCTVLGTKPIIAVEVNGKKTEAFIDTGASSTIMNAQTAEALRIEIPADAPTMMAGGIGGMSPYRGVTVSMRLGPIIRKEFQIMIGGHSGSCVGQDFLQGWRFTVDEKKGYMRFFH